MSPSLITLPIYDLATRSASGFMIRYIVPRLGPPVLYSFMDKNPLFKLLSKKADLIIGVGHGLPDLFMGHNDVTLLKLGEYNKDEVEGKVIRLITCQTANELGPDLIANGCKAYWGFNDDLIWVVDADLYTRPWTDPLAEPSMIPILMGTNLLLNGEPIGEAFNKEQDKYSEMASIEEDDLIRSMLEFNRENSVLLGDHSARVKPRLKISLPIGPPPLSPF